MTVSDQKTEMWKPVPGAGYYEASDCGHIRSVDRTIRGHPHKGVVLKLREDRDGYWVVNITLDDGTRKHNASVARLVLLAHDPDGYTEGLQACHGPGGQKDNRWPENIRWDTGDANRQEALDVRLERNPPKVKPPKVCARCGAVHDRKGRNCLGCMVAIGQSVAKDLAEGVPLDKAADAVDYPPAGAFNLAVRYGGLRVSIARPPVVIPRDPDIRHPESPEPLARRLRRALFHRGPSHQISDRA